MLFYYKWLFFLLIVVSYSSFEIIFTDRLYYLWISFQSNKKGIKIIIIFNEKMCHVYENYFFKGIEESL